MLSAVRASRHCESSDSFDYLFKFLIIGNAATGKSSLLNTLIGHKFKEDRCHTVGIEIGSKVVNIGEKSCKLQIWDTAGQERFRSVTKSYYRGAAGALLVYDITSRDSFNALSDWLVDARSLSNSNMVILLVGNKRDLEQNREVTYTEANQFAEENELIFLETSAKTGENVEEAFLKCTRTIIEKKENNEIEPERFGTGIQYNSPDLQRLRRDRPNQTNSSDCCRF